MLNVWLLSVVALYFCVLMTLMPFSRSETGSENDPVNRFTVERGPHARDRRSAPAPAVLQSSVGAHSFASSGDVAHGYGPEAPYRPAGVGLLGGPAKHETHER